ncbi:MAG TPA: c-type cytochrome, partial [Wenzhouxiangella sp.]|nr:c-type cytochrome [Wenzhouxiangella sp.]
IPEPGQYPFVDHAFAHLDMGAVGILDIREPGTEHGEPNISRDESRAAAAPAVEKPAEGPYSFNPERGDSLYTTHCAACHQPGGEGLPGVFPPLKGDPAVLDPDATKHIDVILNGMQGEAIDGVTYSAPMQAFRDVLDDVDIADIVNHERTSWGNDALLIEPEDVEKLREN